MTERNYMFDTFRGLLIASIPVSHFTRVAGDFSQGSLSGVVYITINVFVMQAFMFLSGYFSKKPQRARETAFKTFMLPYLVFTVIFYFFRYLYFGAAKLNFLMPPFALWFLFSVFFYRFFLKDLIRIKHLLPLCILLYFAAGQVPVFDEFLALGRTVSYFPFFMLGYYCSKERLESLQHLKTWQSMSLAAILIGTSCLLAFNKVVPVGFYLLKTTADEIGVQWWLDVAMRILIFILACAWIVLMINIIPTRRSYLTYIGMNTMPIYIFHLFVRYVIKVNGLPNPNVFVYYLCIFGLAAICVLALSSPPVAKAYDKAFEKLDEMYVALKHLLFYYPDEKAK